MNLPSEVFYIQNKINVLVQMFRNTISKCVLSLMQEEVQFQ